MMKTIPGPQERPFLGSARTFAQDPPEELLRLAETYGEMVRFRLFTQTLYLVSSPELVREVLVTQAGSFPKWSRDVDLLSRFIGRGLVTSNGAYHQKQRQLVQPAFHTRRIAAYADTMVAYTAEMRAGWRDGETRDLSQEMVNLTMFIVGKTLFDADRAALSGRAGRILEASHALQAISDADFKSPIDWPEWLPTARNRRRKAERAVLDRLILGMIAERRAAAVDGRIHDTGDLLSMLLLAQDEAGAAMTDAQVRDELVTLFVAGHETTSNALTWTWYLLAQHPDVEARLHAEVDGVLNGRLPTLNDLKALPYTLMVLKEAMRLYPPAWVLNARQAAADVTLGDYHLPKGSVLFVSPYVMHR
ncbi:MAG: cytochrome P450, partial [Anaerolineales bacterium]|nr:cytochrome P450 [Anaerolineales bacterium]